MTIDILQFVPLRPEVQRELEARYRVHRKDKLDEVASIVRGVVTNGHSGPPPHIIDRLTKLEIICSASVGYDGIPVEYARSKGIPVTNTPEVLNDDVADLAIGLMIMTARRLIPSDRYVRAGRWPREGEFPLASRASYLRWRVSSISTSRSSSNRVRGMASSGAVGHHQCRAGMDVRQAA